MMMLLMMADDVDVDDYNDADDVDNDDDDDDDDVVDDDLIPARMVQTPLNPRDVHGSSPNEHS